MSRGYGAPLPADPGPPAAPAEPGPPFAPTPPPLAGGLMIGVLWVVVLPPPIGGCGVSPPGARQTPSITCFGASQAGGTGVAWKTYASSTASSPLALGGTSSSGPDVA